MGGEGVAALNETSLHDAINRMMAGGGLQRPSTIAVHPFVYERAVEAYRWHKTPAGRHYFRFVARDPRPPKRRKRF